MTLWYAIVEGDVGETLWPNGLQIIDTDQDFDKMAREARRLSSQNVKHYRVVKIEECAVYCAPALRTHKGQGLNPMKPKERAEILADARRQLREQEESKA